MARKRTLAPPQSPLWVPTDEALRQLDADPLTRGALLDVAPHPSKVVPIAGRRS